MTNFHRTRCRRLSCPKIARRAVLPALCVLMAASVQARETRTGQVSGARPNVVVIVADDLGYADLGCHGSTDVRTPHIDSLAAAGIRFTDGYVSGPVCSPARAGLLTGRYQQRFGHEFNPTPTHEMPLSEKTLADHMKQAGYVTSAIGKWHLGGRPRSLPTGRGFDEFFGFPQGAHSYVVAKITSRNPIMRGTTPVAEEEYLTDAFTREAVDFIERQAGKQPFFLYLAYNAVHTPLQAPPKYLERFSSIADEKRRAMVAMLSAMDDGVGAVLNKLHERNVEENTLVFFLSDNGGTRPRNGSLNHPLSGYKSQLFEGGIRIPFMVQWKARLPKGKVYRQPVIALDLLPTILAATGTRLPEASRIDGVDLLPFLTGEVDTAPHEKLFWRFGQTSAIRKGDYKLLILPDEPPKLFNLAEDIAEKHNLAADRPELAKDLLSALKEWDSQLAEPLWPGRPARRAQRRK